MFFSMDRWLQYRDSEEVNDRGEKTAKKLENDPGDRTRKNPFARGFLG